MVAPCSFGQGHFSVKSGAPTFPLKINLTIKIQNPPSHLHLATSPHTLCKKLPTQTPQANMALGSSASRQTIHNNEDDIVMKARLLSAIQCTGRKHLACSSTSPSSR